MGAERKNRTRKKEIKEGKKREEDTEDGMVHKSIVCYPNVWSQPNLVADPGFVAARRQLKMATGRCARYGEYTASIKSSNKTLKQALVRAHNL